MLYYAFSYSLATVKIDTLFQKLKVNTLNKYFKCKKLLNSVTSCVFLSL